MIAIDHIRVDTKAILAPMAGVADPPFRDLCARLGTRLMIGEMLSANTGLWSTRKSQWRQATTDTDSPRWVQIAGAIPEMLAAAARAQQAQGADIIDINMGCPARKVCRRASGSALLRDERLVRAILDAVVAAVSIPVTLKIRTGWCPNTRNATRIARIAEQSGIRLLTIHGRTRQCGFDGNAEYDTIAKVVDTVSIPVIANGDIVDSDSASKVLRITGARAVMIGRAALGKPWLLGAVDHELRTGEALAPPDPDAITKVMLAHLDALYRFYGEYNGVRIARKHVGWYLKARGDDGNRRRKFNALASSRAQKEMLRRQYGDAIDHEEMAA